MQSVAGVRRELFTSLAGTVPLVDVLSDLPIPAPLPTVFEKQARGEMPLSAEASSVLAKVDPNLCAKISAALMAVDTSFLDLKESGPQEVPNLSPSAPLLVRALMAPGLSEPSIKLTKLDPRAQYVSPAKHEPLSTIQEPQRVHSDSKKHGRVTPQEKSAKATSKRRIPSSSSDESHPPAKVTKGSDSTNLIVSIPRTKSPIKHKRSTPITTPLKMTVSIPRNSLRGYHQVPDIYQHPPPMGGVDGRGFVIGMDQVAPSPALAKSEERRHKKKRKRLHCQGDPAVMASFKQFSSMMSALFDQAGNLGAEGVFDRSVITSVYAGVTKLRQHAVLHEVSVSKLVKLINIMDRHVLETSVLSINTPDDWDSEPRVWRELVKERILRSTEAALVILHITTAPNMPKNVHLEESIEQVISMAKFQLEKNIYPQFDGVYRAQNKDSGAGTKQKRKGGSASAGKEVMAIYHKLTEVVEMLVGLVESQPLTDSVILKISSLGICPFFVENINVLQLSAVRLVRSIFARYAQHRDLILEEIFASLARLPTTKRNLRSFKLSNGQSIQMVTALILQLIQCVVTPRPLAQHSKKKRLSPNKEEGAEGAATGGEAPDMERLMVTKYQDALTTATNFLSTFLKKCTSGKDEDDYRPLFENFVQDLLTTLNQPLWPASEALLTLLAVLLVRNFAEKSTETSLRLMSLEHLGTIVARLRHDATSRQEQEHEQLVTILSHIMQSKLDQRSPSPVDTLNMDAFSENSQHMQKAFIAFLNKRSSQDTASVLARDFFIGQWLSDIQTELETVMKAGGGGRSSPTEDFLALDNGDAPAINAAVGVLQQAEIRKHMLVSLTDPKMLDSLSYLEGVLNEETAAVVTRFLASSRSLSKHFDGYLRHLMSASNDSAVHVRTKAMKALSTIIAADPSILSRPEMHMQVDAKLQDTSTLMREAAVDLIGRFVLTRPALIDKYYNMLIGRTMDTGVSVRKRVIKIFRDICVQHPDYSNVPDICMKILLRISDEDGGIKQLVVAVIRELWFSPPPEAALERKEALIKRVNTMCTIVGQLPSDSDLFGTLLEQLLKVEDKAALQSVMDICQMMADCLVENLLALDESQSAGPTSPRLLNCIRVLFQLSKVQPSLLIRHATTISPYLATKYTCSGDLMVVHFVARLLQQVVPLMPHPSEEFLVSVEEDLSKLIIYGEQVVTCQSVSCLAELVCKVTHNEKLVKQIFEKFYNCLRSIHEAASVNPADPQIQHFKSALLRSAYTAGVFCQYFDIDTLLPVSDPEEEALTKQVYSMLLGIARNIDEERTQIMCVSGLGYFLVRHAHLMLDGPVRQLYSAWLGSGRVGKHSQVLKNLKLYLVEVETRLKAADDEYAHKGDKENLQEFGDSHSSVSSEIAQAFLQPVLESLLNRASPVRLCAQAVVILILRQGLVHPTQCVPYLIAMSTDHDPNLKGAACKQLSEHASRYGHFMQTQLVAGVKKSYELQKVLSPEGPRGCSTVDKAPTALLAHVYTLLRSNKQHRRAFLRSLLRHFEDYGKNPLSLLLYLADNLAHLPYNTLEEPLFVAHYIDMTLSVTGSNLLQQFKEALGSNSADDDEDDMLTLSQQQCNLRQLAGCCHASQGCLLLLLLKQHLKKLYSLSDSKCQKYTPNESGKAFDKAVSKKLVEAQFDPVRAIQLAQAEVVGAKPPLLSKDECLRQYLEFKRLMNKLDPFEAEDEGSDQETTLLPPPTTQDQPPLPSSDPIQQQLQQQALSSTTIPPSHPAIAATVLAGGDGRRHRQSRGSSSSSTSSSRQQARRSAKLGQRRSGSIEGSETKHKRKRKRFISTDSEDEGDK